MSSREENWSEILEQLAILFRAFVISEIYKDQTGPNSPQTTESNQMQNPESENNQPPPSSSQLSWDAQPFQSGYQGQQWGQSYYNPYQPQASTGYQPNQPNSTAQMFGGQQQQSSAQIFTPQQNT